MTTHPELNKNIPYTDYGPFRKYHTSHPELIWYFSPDATTIKEYREYAVSLKAHKGRRKLLLDESHHIPLFLAKVLTSEIWEHAFRERLNEQGLTLSEFFKLISGTSFNDWALHSVDFSSSEDRRIAREHTTWMFRTLSTDLRSFQLQKQEGRWKKCEKSWSYIPSDWSSNHKLYQSSRILTSPTLSSLPEEHRLFKCHSCGQHVDNLSDIIMIYSEGVRTHRSSEQTLMKVSNIRCSNCIPPDIGEIQPPGGEKICSYVIAKKAGRSKSPPRILNYSANPMEYIEGFLLAEGEHSVINKVSGLDNTPWMGVEFEVTLPISLFSNGSETRFRHINESLSNTCIFKSDASVYNSSTVLGFEITSVPMTLKKHRQVWKKFFEDYSDKLLVDKYPSGIHVHLNKTSMKPFNRNKLHYFMNRLVNKDFLLLLSERNEADFNKWCTSNFVKLDKYTCIKSQHTMGARELGDKHRIVFTRGSTEEFRLFNATKRFDRFMKNLEFIAAVRLFSIEESFRSLDYFNFVSWIGSRQQIYPNLFLFLYDNGMLNKQGEVLINQKVVNNLIKHEQGRFLKDNKKKESTVRPERIDTIPSYTDVSGRPRSYFDSSSGWAYYPRPTTRGAS